MQICKPAEEQMSENKWVNKDKNSTSHTNKAKSKYKYQQCKKHDEKHIFCICVGKKWFYRQIFEPETRTRAVHTLNKYDSGP